MASHTFACETFSSRGSVRTSMSIRDEAAGAMVSGKGFETVGVNDDDDDDDDDDDEEEEEEEEEEAETVVESVAPRASTLIGSIRGSHSSIRSLYNHAEALKAAAICSSLRLCVYSRKLLYISSFTMLKL